MRPRRDGGTTGDVDEIMRVGSGSLGFTSIQTLMVHVQASSTQTDRVLLLSRATDARHGDWQDRRHLTARGCSSPLELC